MGGIALLGNGLKSVVTSTVLVSEARFASFLGIEVERVALLMEAIVAGMVVALAMYPLVVRRFAVRDVALAAAVIGALAFAAFAAGATDGAGRTREAWAYTCLTLGGAALVWLAPGAQSLVLGWPGTDGRKALTSIWTGATPAGFLAAPQLAKWLLPGLGLSAYFASLAILPLAFAALVATTAIAAQRPDGDDALPVRLVVAFAAAVVTFEAWSTAGSVLGYTAAATLATLPLLAAAAAWFVKRARQFAASYPARRRCGSPLPPCSRWKFLRRDSSRLRFCTTAGCRRRWSPIAPRSPRPRKSQGPWWRVGAASVGSRGARRVDRLRSRRARCGRVCGVPCGARHLVLHGDRGGRRHGNRRADARPVPCDHRR